MAEQRLDRRQIGALFQQMRGQAVGLVTRCRCGRRGHAIAGRPQSAVSLGRIELASAMHSNFNVCRLERSRRLACPRCRRIFLGRTRSAKF